MKTRWQFGVIAGIIVAFFCFYPQLKMFYLRGSEWNGHYAYNDIDEVAYAAYIRALIDGRPRRNDPYSGRDDAADSPQPESLFSIQFAAPYTIAIPARILGIGTPWAMILTGIAAGFFATLLCFWFLRKFSGDDWFAMAGSISVFAFGALAAGEGAFPEIAYEGFSYPYFPGFRRYIPALAMPAFFAVLGFLWAFIAANFRPADQPGRLTSGEMESPERIQRRRLIYGFFASIAFAYCVFSYFYIWTTAAALFGAIVLFWIAIRPKGFFSDLKGLAIIGAVWLLALIPYAYLLSRRADSMDHVQLLVFTRMPDLNRVPEWVAGLSIVLLVFGLMRGKFRLSEPPVGFAFAVTAVPFIVFNQQIITGRSLQPIHYQVFIGNYVALVGLAMSLALLWRRRLGQGRNGPKIASSVVFIVATLWGLIECHYTVRVLDDANIERDKALPVARRLEQYATNSADPHRATVLSYDWIFADDMPSVAPQNILWARHQHVFAGLSWEESKERYYKQLYFQNIDEDGLDYLLRNDFVTMIALFGWGRHTDRLSFDAKPLTDREIREEVANYAYFRKKFDRQNAGNPLISYVVVPEGEETDLSALLRWYALDEGERIGNHILYRARLK